MRSTTDFSVGQSPEHSRRPHVDGCLEPSPWCPTQPDVDHGQNIQIHELWNSQRTARGLLHTSGKW